MLRAQAVEAEATTIGINDGPGSGQEIPHVHIHVIPRRRGDGGGIIQAITRKGPAGTNLADIVNRIRNRIT